ncbi:PE-PPE domain-containing protein [Mycolicibacterium sp. S2-37]|uniref:PE-PPE domain-containing protein n=1 Tax=Mycolicibacterium sp. S2-37 TaxID=2810297 RepID=UPI001A93E4ED|nr:PE-PPE domain-containing protein [Mycolicibacterium sp. S2-37]MBO0678122.1 PE-PPE domain-containing protein [Mycolicibacterium sp. S2-37]
MFVNLQSWGMAVTVPLCALTLSISPVEPLPPAVVSVPAQLAAQGLYVLGTKIGGYNDDDEVFIEFANSVVASIHGGTPFVVDDGDDPDTGGQVEYNGGFRPFSHGGLGDLTFGASVAQGLARLSDRIEREREKAPSSGIGPDDDTLVVFGYSQGAVVVGEYKAGGARRDIEYLLLSNPGRPNGGILSRFQGFTIPILDIPLSGPTPTSNAGWDAEAPAAYDIARQYDGWADFPRYPQNVLSTLNAVLGMVYLHGSYEYEVPIDAFAPDAPNTDVRRYGDTVYYTVGTDLLPLLRPLEQLGVPRPLLLAIDAPLRVIVEEGYDRTTNPGEESPAALRFPDPLGALADVLRAIPVGIDDGLQASGLGRPLNTRPAGMYGVGGPVNASAAKAQAQVEVGQPAFQSDSSARRAADREAKAAVETGDRDETGLTRAQGGVERASVSGSSTADSSAPERRQISSGDGGAGAGPDRAGQMSEGVQR